MCHLWYFPYSNFYELESPTGGKEDMVVEVMLEMYPSLTRNRPVFAYFFQQMFGYKIYLWFPQDF